MQHKPAEAAVGMGPRRATLAALNAKLVGIGLARFAYTPLIPAIIGAGWFAPSQAAYLGAANLAGYLVGALLARQMTQIRPAATVLRTMMLLATASFFACAVPLAFSWYFCWRFVAGLAGGTLMVLGAPTVLAHMPAARRGLAGGVIFTGVGIGIVLSGTLVPLLLGIGLAQAWIGLGLLALLLTLTAWGGWPAGPVPMAAAAAPPEGLSSPSIVKALYVEYALTAVALVPHMVFLVDFVARGLGRGVDAGAHYWVLFGLGALVGPVIAGHAADRIGFRAALRIAYAVEAVAVGALAVTANIYGLALSSIAVGAFTPGITTLVLGRIRELLSQHEHAQKAAWSRATVGFAVGQAMAAYGFSYLYARRGDYADLFVLAAAAAVLALAINLLSAALSTQPAARQRQIPSA
jgi:predicted MFS family arabinose efflux permease